jgi:hypothetical protein
MHVRRFGRAPYVTRDRVPTSTGLQSVSTHRSSWQLRSDRSDLVSNSCLNTAFLVALPIEAEPCGTPLKGVD